MMLFMGINKVLAVENYQTKLTTEKVTSLVMYQIPDFCLLKSLNCDRQLKLKRRKFHQK